MIRVTLQNPDFSILGLSRNAQIYTSCDLNLLEEIYFFANRGRDHYTVNKQLISKFKKRKKGKIKNKTV